MSIHALSDNLQMEKKIKQEIEDLELNAENITEIKSEIDIEEHPLFYAKTEPIVVESLLTFIKSEPEQDLDADVSPETSTVDPLAVDPCEDAESCNQSEDSVKQSGSKKEPAEESIFDRNDLFPSLSPSLTMKKIHECRVCKKTFLKSSHLVEHSRIHTGEKPYECTACNRKFSTSSNLLRHSRIHSGQEPYECTVCKRKFSKSLILAKHLRIHTGEKTYECAVCKKKFARCYHLKIHSRIHTGEKPYECAVCKKTFSFSSNLVEHSRIHTGEKPYECTVCKRKFAYSSVLAKHSHIHSKETS